MPSPSSIGACGRHRVSFERGTGPVTYPVASCTSGDEIIAWAWGLAPDAPEFETAWNALDLLSISED